MTNATAQSKPKRTTTALTREEYELLDKARSRFKAKTGLSLSRASFITYLVSQNLKVQN